MEVEIECDCGSHGRKDNRQIVENRNTCDDNSPTVPLTEKQIAELRACAAK